MPQGMPPLKWQVALYPTYQKQNSEIRPSFCACRKYGGNCLVPIEAGEPIIKFIYHTNRRRGWKKTERWRAECHNMYWPGFLAERHKEELLETSNLHHWYTSNLYKPTVHVAGPGRHRLDMNEESRVERHKLLQLHATYSMRQRTLTDNMPTKSKDREKWAGKLIKLDNKLEEIYTKISKYGGAPKSWTQ